MFAFRCQRCGKQHVVERPFEREHVAKCLRCGERIRVTGSAVRRAEDEPALTLPSHSREAITTLGGAETMAPEAVPDGAGGDDYEPPRGEIPLAETDEGEVIPRRGGASGARPARRPRAGGDSTSDGSDQEDAQQGASDEEPTADEADPPPEPPVKVPFGQRLRERWPLVAGGAVLLATLLGGGGYYLLSKSKKPEPKSVVSKPPPPKKPATAPPPSTQKEPEKPAPLLTVGEPVFFLAATRLSAELAKDAAEANAKYKGKVLEVSGLVDKLEGRLSGPAPFQGHLLFACEGGPAVGCDLAGGPTDINQWRRLASRQPCTARGTYRGDGTLAGCELVSLADPADRKYKGKVVELVGSVESVIRPDARQPFPGIRLEGEADSAARLECYFRTGDGDDVGHLRPADFVIIRGTCGGRSGRPGELTVRLDNCELVYTSAPVPPIVRLDAIAFLREHEEDLRPFFLPAPGAEPRVAETVPVSRLDKELAADPAAARAKYRNKVITVSGKVLSRGERELVLMSGNTEEPLRVACSFSNNDFNGLINLGEYTLRGRWAGLDGAGRLRLVSCASADPKAVRDPRRITPDYLPHRAGRKLIYDVAEFPDPAKKGGPVQRIVFVQREGGDTETLITHVGALTGKDLFDPDGGGRWVRQKKTTREVRLAGPKYRQRVWGGFIEVGTGVLKDRREEVVWDKALKLMARTGDSWKWARDGVTHECTVERFDEEGGRPRVTVTEIISSPLDLHNRYEKRHVYVREVGEVEQRDWLLIDSTQRLLKGEKKLVEDESGPK